MIPGGPWEMIDVSLSDAFDTIEASPDARAVLLLLHYEGVYLGRLELSPASFPLTRREVLRLSAARIASPLRQLSTLNEMYEIAWTGQNDDEQASAALDALADGRSLTKVLSERIAARRSRKSTLSASVAICTARRPQALNECLEHLAEEIAAGREILVVDNAPSSETEQVVQRFAGVRYVPEPRPGLSTARNTAVQEAKGDIVVFVDDDVRPTPGWIEPLLTAFESDGVAVACGLVLPYELEHDAQVLFEYCLGFGGMGAVPLRFDGELERSTGGVIPVWEIGAGANMAVRRSAVIALGGFDERIGPGAAGGCADDSEFWHRALSAGYEARYEPLSVVRHVHRADMDSLRSQARGYFKGHLIGLFAQNARSANNAHLRRALVVLPRWFFALFMKRLKPPLAARDSYHEQHMLGEMVKGYLSGLLYVSWAFKPAQSGLRRFQPDE
jgi:GT2 family glycosyltransferase